MKDGRFAGDCEGIRNEIGDPRLFYNVAAPSSAFICGSQGSGKSHTLSCLLENCLVASDTNVLPRPLSGIAFHYDSFTSDSAGSPCEAAYLSSHSGVKVRVLCAPTNTAHIKVCMQSLRPRIAYANNCSESIKVCPRSESRSYKSSKPTSTPNACFI